MRPRVVVPACIAALVAVSLLVVPATRYKITGVDKPAAVNGSDGSTIQLAAQAAPPPPRLAAPADPDAIKAPKKASFFSWAFLDRKTNKVTGSDNSATGTNTMESMVKPWIASDFLRRVDEVGKTPSDEVLHELTLMLIDSNDDMAQKYYELGGADNDIMRMIKMCGLTETSVYHNRWAMTFMPPRDALKYGQCVANGTAAGPRWTPWILNTMKHVRGGVDDQISVQVQGGRWGIIDGLPDNLKAGTSIKNGWTQYWKGSGGLNQPGWHVNCLAINDAFILSVMVRIDTLQDAADTCAGVARALTVTPDI